MRTSENKKLRTNIIKSLTDKDISEISSDGICILAEDLCTLPSHSPAEIEESVFSSLRQLFEEKIELLVTVIYKTRFDTITAEHLDRLKAITRGIFRAAVYGDISVMYSGDTIQNKHTYESFGSFTNKIFCELEADRREFNGYIKKGIIVGTPTEIFACDMRGIDFLCIDLDRMLPSILCNGKARDNTRKIYMHGKFDTLCATLAEYFSDIKLPVRIMCSTASNSFISTLAATLDAEEIIITG